MHRIPPTRRWPVPKAADVLRRLIDDLEHAASLGNATTPLSPLLSELRMIRDRLILHCPTFEEDFLK